MSVPFGIQLRQARQAHGFSLRDLAYATTYAFGPLSKIELGSRSPTVGLSLCGYVTLLS